MSKKGKHILATTIFIISIVGSALFILSSLSFNSKALKYVLIHPHYTIFFGGFFLIFFIYLFVIISVFLFYLILIYKTTNTYVSGFKKNFQHICSTPYAIASFELKRDILNYSYLVIPRGNLKTSIQIKNICSNLSLLKTNELESMKFKIIDSQSIQNVAFRLISILIIIASGGLIASIQLIPSKISYKISAISFFILIFYIVSAGLYLYLTVTSINELKKFSFLIKREISERN